MIEIKMPSGDIHQITRSQARALVDSIQEQCEREELTSRVQRDHELLAGKAVSRRDLMRRHKATKHEVEAAMVEAGAVKEVDTKPRQGMSRVYYHYQTS